MASYPSDELADRRARRDGSNVVFMDERGGVDAARLAAARHEVAVLTARVGETVAERDRIAALAGGRREQLTAAREREATLRARVRLAEGDLARARDQLAARTTAEASLRVQATGLHARIHALRAVAAGHDARMRELTEVVEELSDVSGAARADVERHLAAREAAEEELAAERARAAGLEEKVAALRTELESLHAARDLTLGAEERMRAARDAELMALRASAERLRPLPPAGGTIDLGTELARAAERLRSSRPASEDVEDEVVVDDGLPVDAAAAEIVVERAPTPAPAPVARAETPPARPRTGGVRGLLHRLFDRRG